MAELLFNLAQVGSANLAVGSFLATAVTRSGEGRTAGSGGCSHSAPERDRRQPACS